MLLQSREERKRILTSTSKFCRYALGPVQAGLQMFSDVRLLKFCFDFQVLVLITKKCYEMLLNIKFELQITFLKQGWHRIRTGSVQCSCGCHEPPLRFGLFCDVAKSNFEIRISVYPIWVMKFQIGFVDVYFAK